MELFERKSTYIWLPLVVGLLAPDLLAVIAKVTVTTKDLIYAWQELWNQKWTDPGSAVVSLIWSLVPFAGLSLFLGLKQAKFSLRMMIFICLGGLVGVLLAYGVGLLTVEQYLHQKMWTAASVSQGFLPMKGLLAVALGMIVGWAAAKRGKVQSA